MHVTILSCDSIQFYSTFKTQTLRMIDSSGRAVHIFSLSSTSAVYGRHSTRSVIQWILLWQVQFAVWWSHRLSASVNNKHHDENNQFILFGGAKGTKLIRIAVYKNRWFNDKLDRTLYTFACSKCDLSSILAWKSTKHATIFVNLHKNKVKFCNCVRLRLICENVGFNQS